MTLIDLIKKLVGITVHTRGDNLHVRIGDDFYRVTGADYYGRPGWAVIECEKRPYMRGTSKSNNGV